MFKHENLSGYTWCYAKNVQKSRIDYIFISKNVVYDVKQIIVRKIQGSHSNGSRMSDHRALTFFLVSKSKGFWKLETKYKLPR